MSGVLITSNSEKGDAAIKRNLDEINKASFKERLLFRQACSMAVVSEDPMTLRIMGKFRYMTGQAIEPIAADMMRENGAKPGEDYTITIEEAEGW